MTHSLRAFASFLSYAAAATLFLQAPLLASAQAIEQNGQFFTKGLAIVDSPNPTSNEQHTGSNIVIAVDLSGDGKIPQSSFVPGSNAETRYDFFEIYLVSPSANFTVSNGSTLLSQESGSTVKHLNFPLPTCVEAGAYNLTFYEGSHIDGQPFFSITPLPVNISSNGQSSDDSECQAISNAVQQQPQEDSAPAVNPILGTVLTTITVTTNLPSDWSIEQSGTSTVPLTTMTVVMVSPLVTTETNQQGQVFTTTESLTSTVTIVVPTSAVTEGNFFPVNGARASSPNAILLCLSFLFLLYIS